MSEPQKKLAEQRHRGFYILPNLFTTGTLFGGFYAIIAATQDHFGTAAMAIVFAMIADMFDGRVARLTNTQSEFGVQYDSLADLIAFGLAPALVSYLYSLQYMAGYNTILGKLGWLAAFFYAATTAMRLARFNITDAEEQTPKNVFLGLPSPAGAGVLIGFIWVLSDFDVDGSAVSVPVLLLTIIAGLLMVSNVRFFSFKHLSFGERVPFLYLFIMLLAVVLALIDPPRVMFTVFLLYALSGPVLFLYRFQKSRRSH